MEASGLRKLRMEELGRHSVDEYRKIGKLPVTVILDNVRSCHNVGSVFRTADALLIEKIYLCGITAVPPNKEIHKTALDAEKSVEWEYLESAAEVVKRLKNEDYKIFAVEQVENSLLLNDFIVGKSQKTALVFGNEISGVRQSVLDLCDGAIEIPQYGTKHSFNVSVCVGIVLWEVTEKYRNSLRKQVSAQE